MSARGCSPGGAGASRPRSLPLRHPKRNRDPLMIRDDEQGMRSALREARASEEKDEVPVGCVIVHEGLIVGRGHNQVEALQDATAHAEIVAIGAASSTLELWRLHECTMYVTLEPCAMCAGAIVL